jgi:hypothetical protein
LSASYALSASQAVSSSFAATASYTFFAVTSSYPISVTGSGTTLYSVSPLANPNFGAGSTHSIFFGQDAGYLVSDAYYSNFIGRTAGYLATNAEDSNFLGFRAGFYATYANRSNFFGNQAGSTASYASQSNFLGYQAGYGATYAHNSNFLGYRAGYLAYTASNSTFIGNQAGNQAIAANSSVFIGQNAGIQAYFASRSIFIGSGSGDTAQNSNNSIFLGSTAGKNASSNHSIYIGTNAGNATNGGNSVIIGRDAGSAISSTSNSVLIGYQAGKRITSTGIGDNNIIIGTNISLPNGTSRAVNIGGILYITGSYGDTTGNPLTTFVTDVQPRVGIGTFDPSHKLHISQYDKDEPQFLISDWLSTDVIKVDKNSFIYTSLTSTVSLSTYDVVIRNPSNGRLYITSSVGGGAGGGSIDTGSFATTGSNIFIGNQVITGSLALPTLTGITDTPNVDFTIPYSSGIYKIAAGDPLGLDMGIVIFPSVVEGASLTVIITSNNNALVSSPYPKNAAGTNITEITGKTMWSFYGIDGYWYGGRLNTT